MKKLTCLLASAVCLFLVGCQQTPDIPNDVTHWEAKGTHWEAETDFLYSKENTEKYWKVTFTCDTPENVYDKSGTVSFALGTGEGTEIYTYSKTEGVLQKEEIHDPPEIERVKPISDTSFEVLYDMELMDFSPIEDQKINVQIGSGVEDESINLRYIESK